jgi:uncharacterized protein (DUF427 family)
MLKKMYQKIMQAILVMVKPLNTEDNIPQAAIWNGKTIARSNKTIFLEGNHYFPPDSISKEYLKESTKSSVCPWKGKAAYYDVLVDGETNKEAAWYYPNPLQSAETIKNYIAFWHGVKIMVQ